MAIDTAAKRASAIGLLPPLPDGTIDQGDRQQASGLYRGITAVAASGYTSPQDLKEVLTTALLSSKVIIDSDQFDIQDNSFVRASDKFVVRDNKVTLE